MDRLLLKCTYAFFGFNSEVRRHRCLSIPVLNGDVGDRADDTFAIQACYPFDCPDINDVTLCFDKHK